MDSIEDWLIVGCMWFVSYLFYRISVLENEKERRI